MTALKTLLEQRAELDRQIEATRSQERAEAISKVRQLMAEHGLTVDDLGAAKRRTAANPVAAKFRNKSTGETWSGRGLKPRWLAAAISGGAKLEDFAV